MASAKVKAKARRDGPSRLVPSLGPVSSSPKVASVLAETRASTRTRRMEAELLLLQDRLKAKARVQEPNSLAETLQLVIASSVIRACSSMGKLLATGANRPKVVEEAVGVGAEERPKVEDEVLRRPRAVRPLCSTHLQQLLSKEAA